MMTDAVNRTGPEGDAHLYALLIIGTGGAGMAAAIRASELGPRPRSWSRHPWSAAPASTPGASRRST
jgi:hypothetical protein